MRDLQKGDIMRGKLGESTRGNLSNGLYQIIAVDFDGTLCNSNYPALGEPNMKLIEWLKRKRQKGCKIILWTCRHGDTLKQAVEFCRKYGLMFDAVNENLPSLIEKYGETRKIAADVYIDDKNLNMSCVPFYGD